MPSPLVWKKLQGEGDMPQPRSGHSFTFVNGQYIYFGGLDGAKKTGKVNPNNDVHTFKIGSKVCHFTQEKCSGDIPPARTNHAACAMPGDRMFIFGGHFTNTQRLNDAYVLDTKSFTWRLVKGSTTEPQPNNQPTQGWPDARANHSLVLSDDAKIYLFGGHGGSNYQRKAMNDLWCFDCQAETWEEIIPQNSPPEGRGSHTSFILGRKIYVYGGWNSNNQFENAIVFDLDTKQWSDPDVYMTTPRWNHSGIMVEAIPSWKYFVFGGSQGEFPENGPRNFGAYSSESAFLDVSSMKFQPITTEDAESPQRVSPGPREKCSIAYDHRQSRILIFGGWCDTWLGDIYALNVSSIVGPPYAITKIEPDLGQLSGNSQVIIKGIGFIDTNAINVRFSCGKAFVDVQGTYISDTQLSCMTPSFQHIGPKEAEVRLSIQNRDYTITLATFNYFMNTRAYKSLYYGPGLLQDCVVGIETSFIVQARNDLNYNRTSGRDKFSVKIRPCKPKAEDEEEVEAIEEDKEGQDAGEEQEVKELDASKVGQDDIPVEIVDNDNGTYTVKYKVEQPGEVEIDVLFENDKGKLEKVRGSPVKANFGTSNPPSANQLTGSLMQKYISKTIEEVEHWEQQIAKGCSIKDKNVASDVKALISVKDAMESVHQNQDSIILKLDVLEESLKMFQKAGLAKDSELKKIKKLFDGWTNLQKIAKQTKREITPYIQTESEKNTAQVKSFEEQLRHFQTSLKKRDYYFYKTGVDASIEKLDSTISQVHTFQNKRDDLGFNAEKFGQASIIENCSSVISSLNTEIDSMKGLWNHIKTCSDDFKTYMSSKWLETNAFDMQEDVKKLFKKLKDMKVDRKCNAYLGISDEIKKWLTFLPLVGELRDESMRDRHWDALRKAIEGNFVVDEKLLLEDIYNLQLHRHVESVEEITDQARQEAKMEKTLNKLQQTWSAVQFDMNKHKDTDIMLLKVSEENFEMLEENQVAVNSMFSSRFLSTFEEKCNYWQKSLASIAEVVQILQEVQRSWSFLENLFIHSEQVKKQLPNESEKFVDIDKQVKTILRDGEQKKNCLDFCVQDNILKRLEQVQKELTVCQKALQDFLDGKRRAFPRFYFVSTTDLLDILSNGNNPPRIMRHMPKIFQAIQELKLSNTDQAGVRPNAVGMHTCVGKEYVDFNTPLQLQGKVEVYLQDVVKRIQDSLHEIMGKSLEKRNQMEREDWIVLDPTQVTLNINLIMWVINVENAFNKLTTDKQAMKTAYKHQVEELTSLIKKVQGKLQFPVRQKIMCLITMDTHSRDVIDKLHNEGVKRADEFQWQSQLKASWDYGKKDARLNVADAEFWYSYEYLGNGPRLVVTPLTDRIYVTATQALHLKMGCAPAGPAGTGKTQTTKDLAAAMGKPCYVFNCSDQMDYQSMGNIYKGLASSGSWGCFDEFNRLVPEVLSVCSVQFKAVTDAIRDQVQRFKLQGDEISLDPTCGVFITMNPGYLGRSELPEGLKTLFRPITVVVPDLELICENMLMAEGFVSAKGLARKFTTLYALCKDLLSKQDHYDWGLRAIKSVLVVAGSFKRGEPDLLQDALLMRALRDFNLPKIVIDDLDIFMGLLLDLFPGIQVLRKRDMDFEAIIEKAADDFKYWNEPEFITKVVQLKELLEIRHCVFIMGPPGCGKSSTWKTLARAQDKAGNKTTYVDINPKTVTTNELYGYVQLSTREWKDGLLSKTMRSLGEIADDHPKWLVLDGDLDTVWIESMNSVMDDNRILTLASNERIPLKTHMRMLFEIRDLRFATPATVSRAGILYISDSLGYQWRSYVKSWVQKQKITQEIKEQLQKLFDKYIPPSLVHMKKSYKFIVPVVEISMIISLCKLLESLMAGKQIKGLEYLFVFCCVWSLGGGYMQTDGLDYRREFSSWWKNQWKTIKFPSKGTVFDYYVDLENSKFQDWNKLQSADIDVDTTQPIANFTVPTPEVVSAHYLMKAFVTVNHPPLLVGNAGCGKTQIAKGLLHDLQSKTDQYIFQVVNFNYYTDSALLQNSLEQPLQKKAGRTYAPPGKYKLIYFIDDINMPMLDDYDTQSAVALLRQHADYGHWYDRVKMQIMDITNTSPVSAMNPTAGSFFVNPRLQRHFWMLAVNFPEQNSLFTIYSTFLNKHFSKFKTTILELVAPIIKTGLTLHQLVVSNFRKTAINFHYEFNIRHLSNVFQGLLVAQPAQFQEPQKLVRLWVHESERIYGDRLVTVQNINTFKMLTADLVKKSFARFNLARYFQQQNPQPLIFSNFANGLNETQYDQFANINALSNVLQEALREYNDTNAVMDLVLFEDAMKHVCRISRIISASAGHALLVGVGGSGKQSLSRLSSFICNFSTTQIMISQSYGIPDLKQDLQKMYKKTGVKDEGVMFLFTEGQISNERFLVYINDLLSSGEIADLFAPEDQDEVVNNIRGAVRSAGIVDNKTNCWNYFIGRVRNNLHMALCFSPVGDNFRNRSRKFPALVNTTVIDWFQPWPYDALLSVADRFLAEIQLGEDQVRQAVVKFMPYSFDAVNVASSQIFDMERRYVYTTPKSFLQLIKLFKTMLGKKRNELEEAKSRYETGVIKIKDTSEVVGALEDQLKVKQVEVKEKKQKADAQAEIVGVEKAKVEIQSDKANIQAKECQQIQIAVEEKMSSVQKDLDDALPLVEKAQEALKGLDIGQFRMMKSFTSPPKEVGDVFSCVISLMQGIDTNIEVDKKGIAKDKSWKQALKVMGNPAKLIEGLTGFKEQIDKGQVNKANFQAIRPSLADPNFNVENILSKSSAAAGICDWVRNITDYYDVVIGVEPKKQKVREAKQQLADATEKKQKSDALVARLMEELGVLQAEFQKAMSEKQQAQDQANRCQRRLGLANRLISALGNEYERWGNSIEEMDAKISVIVGDVLIASAFVSYVGPFNKYFRDMIINDKFMKFFKENNIPMGAQPKPLQILTDEAQIAEWNNQKLPSDQVSTENGAILTNSERWSLIIDPQLQGIAWIREKEKDHNLQITRLTNSKMVRTMEQSIEQGWSVLLENMDEQIDAVLSPVIGRNTIRRGRTRYMRLGDKEIILSPEFKLFMHTKLSNPHYPPEIQAEATLINFTVTESGLEDQLLALVVRKERPDLASKKEFLIKQQNEFKIQLKKLQLELLFQLTNAQGDILENIELIENLERSKKLSTEISEKVEIAKTTSIKINDAAQAYRPAANRGALVFFMMNELYKIHSFYMFSLESFMIVVKRAVDIVASEYDKLKQPQENDEQQEEHQAQEPSADKSGIVAENQEANPAQTSAQGEENKKQGDTTGEEGQTHEGGEPAKSASPAPGIDTSQVNASAMQNDQIEEPMTPRTLKERVNKLIESITFQAFNFTRRGLFERHKLLVATMLTMRVLVRKQEINGEQMMHLVRKTVALDPPTQPESLKFVPESAWPACKGLEQVQRFSNFCSSMADEALHWRKWYGQEKAEVADLPKAYRDVSPFHRLLILRALRPDRLPNALISFINENMGTDYTEQQPFSMEKTYREMGPSTPVFFVLFPGVDPTPQVEKVGSTRGVSIANGKFLNISMGQGQQQIAIKALHRAAEEGTWIMLQNVHLMQSWLKTFERNLEIVQQNSHKNFRCFISAEPPPLPDYKSVPESILQNCVKVSNEAPSDLKANLKRAFAHFTDFHFERAKEHKFPEYKALLFGLCMFHSLILGRRKFGSQGWSRHYNFNDGDLTICADVLNNYLSKYDQVPYEDIRYIYGQIMYGGHITDNWDRRTNATYLAVIIKPQILQNANLALGFKSPDPNKFDRQAYEKYIDEKLPLESPQMFGMHPNAEINLFTQQSDTLFGSIQLMSGSSGGGGGGNKKDELIKEYIIRFLEQLPKDFNMYELNLKIKVKDPYNNVALQQCERMNRLVSEIRRSLTELDSGMKGQLNISDAMEVLSNSLALNKVPFKWQKIAYWSKKGLLEWFADLILRVQQLELWVEQFILPKSLWIAGLFNPMSFLTAIMQVTAREENLPLDSMCLKTDVTNVLQPDQIQANAPNGQYLHGFFLQGGAWQLGRSNDQGNLTEQTLKELHPALPVVQISAIEVKNMVKAGFYECPCYMTSMRGPTYVFTSYLKMESEDFDDKLWILSGVALLMSDD